MSQEKSRALIALGFKDVKVTGESLEARDLSGRSILGRVQSAPPIIFQFLCGNTPAEARRVWLATVFSAANLLLRLLPQLALSTYLV